MLAICLAAAAANAGDYAGIHARAAQAYRDGDMAGFRAAVLDALALRPDYPPMLYNLALADARQGRADEAMKRLERLERMGVALPVDAAAFPSLAGRSGFDDLAAAFEALERPAGEAMEVARLDGETGFLPEGVAVDPVTGDLFLGSVRQARIVRVDGETGEAADFAGDDPERLWGVFGMRVADGRLWVATSAVPETLGAPAAARGRAAVLVYDVRDGALLRHCPAPAPGVLGDLLPHGDGAWVSDSTGGVAFVRSADCAWTPLVPPGRLVSPQGLADGGPGRLFVADYRGGLFLADTARGELRAVPAPPDTTLYGIDGLARAGEWLLAVQNGIRPHRVTALRLSAGGDAVVESRVLARSLPAFDEPTLGVVHDGRFVFVANAGWERYAEPDGGGGPPVVLSVAVPSGR